MAVVAGKDRWRTDGKFFRSGGRRVVMRAVTYGPFPGGWPTDFSPDFQRMAEAGFNAVRLFEIPVRSLLDAAAEAGLAVFGGLQWGQNADFFRDPGLFSAAKVALAEGLVDVGGHPALAGIYVGNEIPQDLVRWMGPLRVRRAVEELIEAGREHAPDLLFAYASYPSTEYLEPENADFTACNVYLEDEGAFRRYVKRLHHVAGDRPLVLSEFGLDSRRNGLEKQAEVLGWARRVAEEEESAGFTVYAWSDRWWNNGVEVVDWDFGLVDREGREKPALGALASGGEAGVAADETRFSVIICTRNGRDRIGGCLEAVSRMDGAEYETIVVDDGSEDGTAEYVAQRFPDLRLLRLALGGGLSAARNAGAAVATGDVLAFTDDDCEPDCEWLARLRRVFADGRFAAAGGPNLPPVSRNWREAVVRSAPGAPSHVMLDDEEAEHLPGCNIAVTKEAFDVVGGFDPVFHTAGDDVDFCWRLREAGYRLGFAPGAFVWHWRRPSLRGFLKQQVGYGEAERLLIGKYPEKFSENGGAKWEGFVYGGGPVRVMGDSVIYHGPMAGAGYQSVTNRMLPLRGLDAEFRGGWSGLALGVVRYLAPRLRAWARCHRWRLDESRGAVAVAREPTEEWVMDGSGTTREACLDRLVGAGWKPGGDSDEWDVENAGTRVLLATGHGERGSRHLLVRVWGDASLARAGLSG